VEHHEAALDLHERMRAIGWAARSRYDLARALIDRGDEARAGDLLEEAAQAAEGLGMATLMGEIRELA
jgi:Tfp pilus assembly protein FimV